MLVAFRIQSKTKKRTKHLFRHIRLQKWDFCARK